MNETKQPLVTVALSACFLAVMVSFVILGLGVMFFFLGQYRHAVSFALLICVMIGATAVILDLVVVLQSVRNLSWNNVLIVGLTLGNVALTGILVFLFRYFSQPIAGTGLA